MQHVRCAVFDLSLRPPAPLLAADSPTAVEGEYIVVLKEELADQDGEGGREGDCV